MSSLRSPSNLEIVEPIRRSIVVLAVRMFLLLFLADTIYALLLLIVASDSLPSQWSTLYTTILWAIHTGKSLLVSWMLIKLVVDWISTLYFVSNGHLIRQRGVLHIRETIFQLTDIEGVALNQSWLGNKFDFGDVTITFLVAGQREAITLYAINHPVKYEQ